MHRAHEYRKNLCADILQYMDGMHHPHGMHHMRLIDELLEHHDNVCEFIEFEEQFAGYSPHIHPLHGKY